MIPKMSRADTKLNPLNINATLKKRKMNRRKLDRENHED